MKNEKFVCQIGKITGVLNIYAVVAILPKYSCDDHSIYIHHISGLQFSHRTFQSFKLLLLVIVQQCKTNSVLFRIVNAGKTTMTRSFDIRRNHFQTELALRNQTE